MAAPDTTTGGAPHNGPSHASAQGIDALTPARRVVLDVLGRRAMPMTVADVAEETGLHLNTVREHLEFLIDAGLAKRGRLSPSGRGRPASTYSFAPQAELLSRGYALVAGALVDYLATTFGHAPEVQAHAEAVGRHWGREILARMSEPGAGAADGAGGPALPGAGGPSGDEAVADRCAGLLDLLETAGFEPRDVGSDDGIDVRLYRCPVLTLARSYPLLVCAAHLGMAREYVGSGDGGSGAGGEPPVLVEAFVDPGYCTLRVGPVAGAGGLVVGDVPAVVL